MKKRNAKVFALFMSVAMAMPNVAAAMPVYAAPEFEDEADFGDKFEEEFEAEAEEEVETEDTTNDDEEFAEETEDIVAVTASGTCGKENSPNAKIEWTLTNGNLLIEATGVNQRMEDFSKDKPAPWDHKEVKTVQFKGDIVNVGKYAFYGCENLESVNFLKTEDVDNYRGLYRIDDYAFAECPSLKKVTYQSVDDIVVEYYGEGAFANDVSLEHIDFSQRVQQISDFTFYNCRKLVPDNDMIQLPVTLTSIGRGAFWCCESIQTITIPHTVTVIGGGYAGELDINLDPIGDPVGYEGDKFDSSDKAMEKDGADGKWGAFAGCTGLKSVTLISGDYKNEVTNAVELRGAAYIGDFAFFGCTSLNSITLPRSLQAMGDYSFACCGVTDVTILDSGLRSLYGTFDECTKLTKVTFGTDETRLVLDDDTYANRRKDGLVPVKGYWCGIQEIGYKAFMNCESLTDINISPKLFNYALHEENDTDTWAIIGESAFRGCSKLTHFDFPADTYTIGSSAFRDDVLLNHVVLPETTHDMGANTFYGDVAIEDFYIPATMKQIGADSFTAVGGISTMKLMDLYYGGTTAQWNTTKNGINPQGNSLIIADNTNVQYKATRYYNTDPTLEKTDNVNVVLDEGTMAISWDPVTMIEDGKEIKPSYYEVYLNHVGGNTLEEQWKTVTPGWQKIGVPTMENLNYSLTDVAKPGEIYNFRVLAYFGNKHGYLTASKEYKVPSAEDEKKIENMEFEQTNVEVTVGKSGEIKLNVTPEGVSTKDISWSSSDSEIAGVTTDDAKVVGTVTGVKTGTATITAKTSDGIVATCTITVVPKDWIQVQTIKFEQESVTVKVAGKENVSVKVTPDNASATNYIWKSSNNQIATVVPSGDEKTAIITGVEEGKATISVTSTNGTTASIEVTVSGKSAAATGTRFINDTVYIDGVAQKNYTGLAMNGAGENAPFIYIENDKRNEEKTGYVNYDGAKFYVKDGALDTTMNGVMIDGEADPLVWYFCANGQVQTQHKGLAEYDGEWFYIEDGKVAVEMNKFVSYDGGLFAVAAGRIVKEYSGLMQDPTNAQTGAWYFFANGQAQLQYTGLAEYDGHWFYVVNGKFDPAYTGTVNYNGGTFNVVNGEAQIN